MNILLAAIFARLSQISTWTGFAVAYEGAVRTGALPDVFANPTLHAYAVTFAAVLAIVLRDPAPVATGAAGPVAPLPPLAVRVMPEVIDLTKPPAGT